MKVIFRYSILAAVLFTIGVLECNVAAATDWSELIKIDRRREGTVVSYRAKVDAGYLVVEVTHGEGWHTYTMDNILRAQKKSGKEKPETELPTVIQVGDGLTTSGDWFQSTPKDLSMQEIKWYTWGFVETAYFAIRIDAIAAPETTLTINAQACNASSCSMVDAQTITLALPATLPDTIASTPPLPDKSFVQVGDEEALKSL